MINNNQLITPKEILNLYFNSGIFHRQDLREIRKFKSVKNRMFGLLDFAFNGLIISLSSCVFDLAKIIEEDILN